MATEIKVSDLGTNVDMVVILKWLKKEGDAVKRGDLLCEVQTDKANTELEYDKSTLIMRPVFGEYYTPPRFCGNFLLEIRSFFDYSVFS